MRNCHIFVPLAVLVQLSFFIGCDRPELSNAASQRVNLAAEPIRIHHDFGIIDSTAELTATESFRNTQDRPVVIGGLKVACGCTTVEEYPEEVAAGESGTIKFQFNARGKQGSQSQSIMLLNSAQTTPLVILEVSAVVRSTWCHPGLLSLGTLTHADAPIEKSFLLVTSGYEDGEFTDVAATANVPWVELKRDDLFQPDGDPDNRAIARFMLRFLPDQIPLGRCVEHVQVTLARKGEVTTHKVSIHGEMSGGARVIPGIVNFGVLDPSGIKRTCRVKFPHPSQIGDITLTADHPEIHVSVTAVHPESSEVELELIATHPAVAAISVMKGSVTGSFNGGSGKFTVPYLAVCRVQ